MLIDEFLSVNQKLLVTPHSQAMTKILQPLARKATVVRADNIAHYLFVECAQEEWDLMTDFPCVVPPFPTTWIEWRLPALTNSQGTITPSQAPNMTMAMLFDVIDLEKEEAPPARSEDDQIFDYIRVTAAIDAAAAAWVKTKFQNLTALRVAIPKMPPQVRAQFLSRIRVGQEHGLPQWKAAGVRWTVRAFYFLRFGALALPAPYEYQFFLRQDGRPMLIPGSDTMFLISCHDPAASAPLEKSTSIFFAPLLTFSFLHCKNVRRVQQDAPTKLNKARVKRGKPPLVHYYTLEIDPMKKVLRHEGQSDTVGLKKALHICRGHFANYTDGKGLFGKYHGQFWVPQHVRGSADHGTVQKDYEVLAPKPLPPTDR